MIPIYNTWCICVMHDIQIVLMWTTSNFALHYSYKYYIIIHIYIIILYHFVYIIIVNTKTSLPLHNLDSKIIVWRWSQIEALLVTNRAGSQIEALCGHKSCRSHKLKRVTNRAVTPSPKEKKALSCFHAVMIIESMSFPKASIAALWLRPGTSITFWS